MQKANRIQQIYLSIIKHQKNIAIKIPKARLQFLLSEGAYIQSTFSEPDRMRKREYKNLKKSKRNPTRSNNGIITA